MTRREYAGRLRYTTPCSIGKALFYVSGVTKIGICRAEIAGAQAGWSFRRFRILHRFAYAPAPFYGSSVHIRAHRCINIGGQRRFSAVPKTPVRVFPRNLKITPAHERPHLLAVARCGRRIRKDCLKRTARIANVRACRKSNIPAVNAVTNSAGCHSPQTPQATRPVRNAAARSRRTSAILNQSTASSSPTIPTEPGNSAAGSAASGGARFALQSDPCGRGASPSIVSDYLRGCTSFNILWRPWLQIRGDTLF